MRRITPSTPQSMHPDLVRRVLETYYQSRVFFDTIARDHGTKTPVGVQSVTVARIRASERKGGFSLLIKMIAGEATSGHQALAMETFRTGLAAQIQEHVSPFLETLAEAMPVARPPFGGIRLTHQQPKPDLDHTDEDPAPKHRLLLEVNGLTLQNGDQSEPFHLTWPGLLHFLKAAHPMPSLLVDNHISAYGRNGVVAATREDAEVLWEVSERRIGHSNAKR